MGFPAKGKGKAPAAAPKKGAAPKVPPAMPQGMPPFAGMKAKGGKVKKGC